MQMEMTVWSQVMQWFDYLAWCASVSDPACRPFVGFLALAGASGGASTLLVIGMMAVVNGWEREVDAARAVADRKQRRNRPISRTRRTAPLREPALGLGAAVASHMGHAEPLMPAASALAVEGPAVRAVAPLATAPLHRTL
jgi:hypothetical protein